MLKRGEHDTEKMPGRALTDDRWMILAMVSRFNPSRKRPKTRKVNYTAGFSPTPRQQKRSMFTSDSQNSEWRKLLSSLSVSTRCTNPGTHKLATRGIAAANIGAISINSNQNYRPTQVTYIQPPNIPPPLKMRSL